MGQLIELLGSTVIAGYIILIILSLNMKMNSNASQYFQDTFNQRNAITAGQVIEDDFYKIGYKVSGNKILQADSSTIKYLADYTNTSSIDTISYSVGSKTALSATSNPNDVPLYRKLNQRNFTVAVVTRFNLQYYDSSLNVLSYASLSNPSNLAKIHEIRAYVKTELPDQVSNTYSPLEWRQTIRPRSIQ